VWHCLKNEQGKTTRDDSRLRVVGALISGDRDQSSSGDRTCYCVVIIRYSVVFWYLLTDRILVVDGYYPAAKVWIFARTAAGGGSCENAALVCVDYFHPSARTHSIQAFCGCCKPLSVAYFTKQVCAPRNTVRFFFSGCRLCVPISFSLRHYHATASHRFTAYHCSLVYLPCCVALPGTTLSDTIVLRFHAGFLRNVICGLWLRLSLPRLPFLARSHAFSLSTITVAFVSCVAFHPSVSLLRLSSHLPVESPSGSRFCSSAFATCRRAALPTASAALSCRLPVVRL